MNVGPAPWAMAGRPSPIRSADQVRFVPVPVTVTVCPGWNAVPAAGPVIFGPLPPVDATVSVILIRLKESACGKFVELTDE